MWVKRDVIKVVSKAVQLNLHCRYIYFKKNNPLYFLKETNVRNPLPEIAQCKRCYVF